MITLGETLHALLSGMALRGERAAVLRNYELLPEDNAGNDVDLIVTAFDLNAVIGDLHALPGVRVTSVVARSYVTHIFVDGVAWSDRRRIQLDLITALGWKGLTYLTGEEATPRSIPVRPELPWLCRVDDVDEAIAMLMANVIVAGQMKQRYEGKVKEVFAQSPEVAVERIGRWAGEAVAREIVRGASAGDWRGLESAVGRYRRSIAARALTRPNESLSQVSSYYWAEMSLRMDRDRELAVWHPGLDAAQVRDLYDGLTKESSSWTETGVATSFAPHASNACG